MVFGFGNNPDKIRSEIIGLENDVKTSENLKDKQELIADSLRKQLRALSTNMSLQEEEQKKDLQRRLQECNDKIDKYNMQIYGLVKTIVSKQKKLAALDARSK